VGIFRIKIRITIKAFGGPVIVVPRSSFDFITRKFLS
jgi:hypothetical protein